jgi:hypothetical protein
MKEVAKKIEQANEAISKARLALSQALEQMLGENTHTFKTYDVYVTDEEECERLKVKSCNKDEVELMDGSTIEIGSIPTDDLHNVVDMLHSELTEK